MLFSSRIRASDKMFMTKHLYLMIKSGLPLHESLALLRDQATPGTFKDKLSRILRDVENGKSLSRALARFPGDFDHLFLSLIEIGEKSGNLENNLAYLANYQAKSWALKKKVQGALLYPALVLFLTLGMGGFIAFFILPQLVDFFHAFPDMNLPLMTRVLLFFAEVMKSYGVILAVFGFLVIMGFIGLWKIRRVRVRLFELFFRVPLIGKILMSHQLAQFTRNLGLLLHSGVPILSSLDIVIRSLTNPVYKRDLELIRGSLTKGHQVGAAFAQYAFFEYPSLVYKMISVGEETGKLDETLFYLAEFYDEEIDTVVKNLSTLLEPVLLVTIGLAVGALALAIISPIYQLTGSLGS